ERLKLPTENRRQFVLHKTRTEFRESRELTDPKKIRSLVIVGNTHLDTVMIQAKHLSTILEYEPTPIEIRLQEKEAGGNATASTLSPEDQKTLTINKQHIELERKREQERQLRQANDNNEDDI
ncbi:hypothetical protein SAMD00019534_098970, partial [Acytostelium subglobosum LB1]|uniref:hypothetical protein n=1 Tax=Acytostelium subglobosum LB1 TaxID=1410327 RepID=UPI000644B7CA